MADHILQLLTDRLAAGTTLALAAGPHRVLYVAAGGLLIEAAGTTASLAPNSAWQGQNAAALRAGAAGARLLRFELLPGTARDVAATLAVAVTLDPREDYLMRCDRVDFPPGGVAYTHTHQGPGIRCLEAGTIRIETGGSVHRYAPGEAWFERGPDPVFAAGSETEPTHFIRTMILPRAFLGRSSIRYVRAEDRDKPKRQSYQVFVDTPIALSKDCAS